MAISHRSPGDPLQRHRKTHPDTNAYGSDPHNCAWGRRPEMMLFHFCLNFFRWVVKGHDTWQHVRSEPWPGLLQLASTHYRPWTHIALDFVTSLPTSKNTTVILSILSRSAHFIALDKLSTASEKAKLLIDQVFQLHGIWLRSTSHLLHGRLSALPWGPKACLRPWNWFCHQSFSSES